MRVDNISVSNNRNFPITDTSDDKPQEQTLNMSTSEDSVSFSGKAPLKEVIGLFTLFGAATSWFAGTGADYKQVFTAAGNNNQTGFIESVETLNEYQNILDETEAVYLPFAEDEKNTVLANEILTQCDITSAKDSQREALQNAIDSGVYSQEELKTIAELVTNNTFRLGSTGFFGEKYDQLNEILYGEPRDPALRKQLDEIGEEFGIEIKIENNRVLYDGNGEAPECYITSEYIQNMREAFSQMQKMNQQIPQEIYLTGFFDVTNKYGEFFYENPNAIYINANASSMEELNDGVKMTIFHESAHMADYSNLSENERGYEQEFASSENQNGIYVWGNEGLEGCDTTTEAIEKYAGYYATGNNQEFTAEISAMITNEIIVQKQDGSYTINPDKIDKETNTYQNTRSATQWQGTQEQVAELNAIMKVYEKLSKGLITTPLVIQ